MADKNNIIEKLHSDMKSQDTKVRETKFTFLAKIKALEEDNVLHTKNSIFVLR